MGGRGINAGGNNAQIKMDEYIRRLKIEDTRKTWEAYRRNKLNSETGGNAGSQMMRKRCVCCLQYSLPAFTEYETCPLCGWIDDPEQNRNPTSNIGCNSISLLEAQKKWAARKAKK